MAEQLKVINLEGNLGIEQADSLKTRFLEEIKAGNALIVNLSRATSLDLSVIQILLSAQLSAHAKGLSFQYSQQVAEGVWENLLDGGFISPEHALTYDLQKSLAEFLHISGGSHD